MSDYELTEYWRSRMLEASKKCVDLMDELLRKARGEKEGNYGK